ncbi:MAG: M28 family peptidase [Pyrinomonadaceae bacterium]|nr:M28 family peptidase [Sphingobacteriaceae bacterium]
MKALLFRQQKRYQNSQNLGSNASNLKSFPRHIFWLLLLGVSLKGFAQDQSAIKYASLLTADNAKKHLSILASDEFEGRETGKPGADKAAKYIAEEFKKIGLVAPVNGSYFQNIGLVESTFMVDKFQINKRNLKNHTDFYLGGSSSKKAIKAKELVFAGYGISEDQYDDLKGIDISGKVVLIYYRGEPVKDGISVISNTAQPSDWVKTRNKRIQNLRVKNPALILAINPDLAKSLSAAGAQLGQPALSLKKEPSVEKGEADVIQLTSETADIFLKNSGTTLAQLTEIIKSSGKPASRILKFDFEASYGAKETDVKAVNVLGYLEGSDLKNELLVISAHYDHIGLEDSGTDRINNGADDDGSGTTAVLELARTFSQAKLEGKGPRRSILFLAVAGEEKGLLGSEWYSAHPVFPLANTVTDLNIDMIGRVDPAHKDAPEYCYLIGSDKLSSQLHKISENANETYTKLKIDYKFNDPNDPERIYYRSDHYNFAKHNIPIIFYFNGVHEDYHKPSDEVSKINFPLLAKRAQLVFYTAWDIVNRDKRPEVDVKNDMPQSR